MLGIAAARLTDCSVICSESRVWVRTRIPRDRWKPHSSGLPIKKVTDVSFGRGYQ